LNTVKSKMDTQTKKLNIIAWLLKLQDEETIKKIENLRLKTDFWDELTTEEKQEINDGIAELDRGEKHPYEGIISAHRKK